MSSEIGTSIREHLEPRPTVAARRERRVLAVLLLGPVTMLGALVWAVAQPYRIAFLDSEGKGFWDYLVQPPLLVALVGLVYMVVIAPGLAEDLERERDGSQS